MDLAMPENQVLAVVWRGEKQWNQWYVDTKKRREALEGREAEPGERKEQ